MGGRTVDAILDKINKDWMIELLIAHRCELVPFDMEVIANDIVNDCGYERWLGRIDSTYLHIFVDKERFIQELEENKKNRKYFDYAVLKDHIKNNLINRKEELIDIFVDYLFGIKVETIDDYIEFVNKRKSSDFEKNNERIMKGIIIVLSKRFDYEKLLKMFTDKLVNVAISYRLDWSGYEMTKKFMERTIMHCDEDYWRFYFEKIHEKLHTIMHPEELTKDQKDIIRIVDNVFENKKMELLV